MGACFTKLIEDCKLQINCAASWIHPGTSAQLILLGCEEGIYLLDTSQLHDGKIEKVSAVGDIDGVTTDPQPPLFVDVCA